MKNIVHKTTVSTKMEVLSIFFFRSHFPYIKYKPTFNEEERTFLEQTGQQKGRDECPGDISDAPKTRQENEIIMIIKFINMLTCFLLISLLFAWNDACQRLTFILRDSGGKRVEEERDTYLAIVAVSGLKKRET